MRDIRRDTGCALDIEKGELADTRVELQEEGQRLSNTTGGTENGNLGGLIRGTVSQLSMAVRLCGEKIAYVGNGSREGSPLDRAEDG